VILDAAAADNLPSPSPKTHSSPHTDDVFRARALEAVAPHFQQRDSETRRTDWQGQSSGRWVKSTGAPRPPEGGASTLDERAPRSHQRLVVIECHLNMAT
jgi:hypothetical protein